MNYFNLPYVKAFVDGTFYHGMYGGGYVIMDPQDNIIYTDCGIGKQDKELLSMRNISGEMTAAMRATKWIDTHVGKGIIIHDYNGLAKWVTGEWQANKKYTKLYADFMKPFYTLDIISFQWVKGHTNIQGNEIADKLAKEAVVYNKQWKF